MTLNIAANVRALAKAMNPFRKRRVVICVACKWCRRYTKGGRPLTGEPVWFHDCQHPANRQVSHVTGEAKLQWCERVNGYGECRWFEALAVTTLTVNGGIVDIGEECSPAQTKGTD